MLMGAGVATNDAEGNSSRYAGRGGLGAVMGSKGVKAIVVDAPKTFDVPVKDKERFSAAAKNLPKFLWITLLQVKVSLPLEPTY
ncbi:hypothetical protein N752_27920 [Desulforamulus aquiferis]|nr:hypothetical protein N752_27920 [Desulforamulus aquiferis]